LVRLAFYMRFPIARPWRSWAGDQIQIIYGDHPSEEDINFTLAGPVLGVRSATRKSPARRKLMRLHAAGLKSDGSPMPPESPWLDAGALSDRVLYVLPVLFPLCALGVSALIALVVLHFA